MQKAHIRRSINGSRSARNGRDRRRNRGGWPRLLLLLASPCNNIHRLTVVSLAKLKLWGHIIIHILCIFTVMSLRRHWSHSHPPCFCLPKSVFWMLYRSFLSSCACPLSICLKECLVNVCVRAAKGLPNSFSLFSPPQEPNPSERKYRINRLSCSRTKKLQSYCDCRRWLLRVSRFASNYQFIRSCARQSINGYKELTCSCKMD